jgi:AraC-like DNA-binding protein
MQGRTVSATWVRGVFASLEKSGVDVTAVCRDAGVDQAAILAGDTPCPSDKMSALWESATKRSRNPAIGLAAGHTTNPASFDVVGYAMMSSATLLDGLERLQRYLRLVADDHAVHLRRVGTSLRVTIEIGGAGRVVPAARYDSVILTLLTFCRWMTGRALTFQRLELRREMPSNLRPYKAIFDCPMVFGVRDNSVIFHHDDLSAPLPTANPLMIEMLDRMAGEKLRRLDQDTLATRVAEHIRRLLPDGEPSRAAVAQMLTLGERTLQRQLSDAGTSYQQILDETRRSLAKQYLAQADVSLSEAAYLLGFAEQSIFTRACKRWFAAAPGQVRARLIAGCAASP